MLKNKVKHLQPKKSDMIKIRFCYNYIHFTYSLKKKKHSCNSDCKTGSCYLHYDMSQCIMIVCRSANKTNNPLDFLLNKVLHLKSITHTA